MTQQSPLASKGSENLCSCKNFFMIAYGTFIHNHRKKLEVIKVYINWEKDKQKNI